MGNSCLFSKGNSTLCLRVLLACVCSGRRVVKISVGKGWCGGME